MRFVRSWLLLAVALLALAGVATAQTVNGTISGHVADAQNLALPGVTVTAASPNLQGVRTVVTSENGDYVLSLLPSGTYEVSFELSGFQMVKKTVSLAPTQQLPLDAQMGPAAITETVNVTGRAADVLTQTMTVATNFKQDLVATLPTNRDINAVMLMAPNVHASGPSGNYSIAGAMSFESSFRINGVNVNENIRGQATTPYIEDAVQETTVATDGVSAEFGGFSGGVVNMITKSGGNIFTGTFRDTLNNDNWRAYVTGNDAHPFRVGNVATGALIDCETCGANGIPTKVNTIVPQYEYTLGGPIMKDHTWFFTAGRFVDQQSSQQTIAPVNLAYTRDDDRKRYEIKLTHSVTSNHRFEGVYSRENLTAANATFSTAASMDQASLYTTTQPTTLFTLNYNGILTPKFVIEARYSMRGLQFINSGSQFTDRIKGTLLLDRARGGRYWSPTFCGVCDPEKRDNDDTFIKGTYFLSTKSAGSHNIVGGFDSFNDKRFANNHQSGSDYRINGTTTTIVGAGASAVIYPSWTPGASTILQYNPIATSSLGTNFRTNSGFVNDNWRVSNNITLNLGLRFDKNHGVDSAGNLVAKDSLWSPRVGIVWDPKGDGVWAVTASVARYVAGLANSIADGASAAGNPATIQWTYSGAAINPAGTPTANLINSETAIQMMFNWCAPNASGFCTVAAPSGASFPGVSVKIPDGLSSPNVRAYAFGVSRQIGNRAAIRADYSYRDFHDFYSQRIDTTTGRVVDQLGNPADLGVIENSDGPKRRYQGLSLSATYRVSGRTDVGGNYTVSRLWGNFDGENVTSGPLQVDFYQYPEYRNLDWFAPIGDLSADERHRGSFWINYGVPKINGLTLSLLETYGSGLPYGVLGTVDARPFVDAATAAKYVTPQGAASETYYYTNRDAFRTDGFSRADFAASYNYGVGVGSRKLDLFIQAQVLNVFNQQDLCGCGGTVFVNGGNLQLSRVSGGTQNQSIQTPVLNPTTMARFNPFTTTPVEGVNFARSATFGTPVNRFSYTSPREFRLSFGVRF
jgi:Carboxypeptidase regulatory-like domain/TonB dependent receptor